MTEETKKKRGPRRTDEEIIADAEATAQRLRWKGVLKAHTKVLLACELVRQAITHAGDKIKAETFANSLRELNELQKLLANAPSNDGPTS